METPWGCLCLAGVWPLSSLGLERGRRCGHGGRGCRAAAMNSALSHRAGGTAEAGGGLPAPRLSPERAAPGSCCSRLAASGEQRSAPPEHHPALLPACRASRGAASSGARFPPSGGPRPERRKSPGPRLRAGPSCHRTAFRADHPALRGASSARGSGHGCRSRRPPGGRRYRPFEPEPVSGGRPGRLLLRLPLPRRLRRCRVGACVERARRLRGGGGGARRPCRRRWGCASAGPTLPAHGGGFSCRSPRRRAALRGCLRG